MRARLEFKSGEFIEGRLMKRYVNDDFIHAIFEPLDKTKASLTFKSPSLGAALADFKRYGTIEEE